MTKRLYKSNHDQKIDGVCAGMAEYLNVDPTLVRLAWVVAGFMQIGIIAYIACIFIIPRDPGAVDGAYYDGGNQN